MHNLHVDKDEQLHKKNGQILLPILSTVTYLNDNLIPTIFTNIKNDDENINSIKKKILFSFPNKLKHICFNGSYKHGVFNILQKNEDSRKTLMINLWKIKPTEVDYYKPDINTQIYNLNEKYINLVQVPQIKQNYCIKNFQDCFKGILEDDDTYLTSIKDLLLKEHDTQDNFNSKIFEFEK